MRRIIFLLLAICLVNLILLDVQVYGFDFTAGCIYATKADSRQIAEYDSSGAFLSSIDLSFLSFPDGLRGMAFGPDNLLYIGVSGTSDRVIAINNTGQLVKQYSFSTGLVIWGNTSYGKIDFDKNGHFYVGGNSGIERFNVGDNSPGIVFYDDYLSFDVKVLPNGNILSLSRYDVIELDNSGNTIRTLSSPYFGYVRGLEYDSEENAIFVASLGIVTGDDDTITKVDAATGQMLATRSVWGIDDLFLANDGHMLAGSRWHVPEIYSTDLSYIKAFGGSYYPQFVTQYNPVPEPATIALIGLGAIMLRWKRTV